MIAAETPQADRIDEVVVLPQPRARVWRALTDPAELGAWFGMNLAGATIEPGAEVRGPFTIPGHEHQSFTASIDALEPETRFAWRWHPGDVDPSVDLSDEPQTLVSFFLEDAAEGGTRLRVVESGFERIAEARRAKALRDNAGGWKGQLQQRLPSYLASAS